LSLFVYFKKSEKKFLVLSGFFLGLSVITKYVANVLFVYFFLIFLLEYVFYARDKIPIVKYLKQALADYAILFATALATAFVFFPATWIDFSKLVDATVGNDVFSSTWPLFAGVIGLITLDILIFKTRFSSLVFGFLAARRRILAAIFGAVFLLFSAFVFFHVYVGLSVFDLQEIIASPKGIGEGGIFQNFGGALSADFFSLLFSVSPLVLFFILFAAIFLLWEKELKRDSIIVTYIIIFILMYYVGSAINEVVTIVRYQIMVYPLIFVMAAVGASRFLDIEKIKKYVALPAAYAVSIIVLLASLFIVKPHYLAYASEIMPKNFIVNLKGMGEGSIEAAHFLNELPDARNMTIWSDKGAVCEAFLGKCVINFKREDLTENKIDYFVISTDRMSRSIKLSRYVKNIVDFEEIYKSDKYIFNLIISNNPNNFVRVIKAPEFPAEK